MDLDAISYPWLTLPNALMNLGLAVLLAWLMAWNDIKTRRIPNYLTLGSALAGLIFQWSSRGWPGVADAFWGLILGFGLLIIFYWKGGLAAGDVKAFAGLGAWLGPWLTIYLFIFTGVSGLFVMVGLLWWRGLLWTKIRQLWRAMLNLILLRSHPALPGVKDNANLDFKGIPYAVAMALGVTALFCWRFFLK